MLDQCCLVAGLSITGPAEGLHGEQHHGGSQHRTMSQHTRLLPRRRFWRVEPIQHFPDHLQSLILNLSPTGNALPGKQHASHPQIHSQWTLGPQHYSKLVGQPVRVEQQMDCLPLRDDDDCSYSPCNILLARSCSVAIDPRLVVDKQIGLVVKRPNMLPMESGSLKALPWARLQRPLKLLPVILTKMMFRLY